MTLLIIMSIFMTLAWRISDAFKEKALHVSLVGQMGYDEKSNNEVACDGVGVVLVKLTDDCGQVT